MFSRRFLFGNNFPNHTQIDVEELFRNCIILFFVCVSIMAHDLRSVEHFLFREFSLEKLATSGRAFEELLKLKFLSRAMVNGAGYPICCKFAEMRINWCVLCLNVESKENYKKKLCLVRSLRGKFFLNNETTRANISEYYSADKISWYEFLPFFYLYTRKIRSYAKKIFS